SIQARARVADEQVDSGCVRSLDDRNSASLGAQVGCQHVDMSSGQGKPPARRLQASPTTPGEEKGSLWGKDLGERRADAARGARDKGGVEFSLEDHSINPARRQQTRVS